MEEVIEETTSNKEEKKKGWYWLNKKCKYGEKCNYEHPAQCKTLLGSGRCPDGRCKLSHLKICRGIYYNGYCSRRNCWFIHPTSIKNKYQNIMTNELNRGNQPQNNQRELRNNHEQYNYNRNYTPNDIVTWSKNNSINSNPQTF